MEKGLEHTKASIPLRAVLLCIFSKWTDLVNVVCHITLGFLSSEDLEPGSVSHLFRGKTMLFLASGIVVIQRNALLSMK